MGSRGWRTAACATVASAGIAFAACGDDDSTTAASEESTTEEAASAETVDVTATEYAFDLSAEPTTETTSFEVTNEGKEFHVMIFGQLGEGYTVDEAVKLEGKKGSATTLAEAELPPGETVTAEVRGSIEGGDYVMLCPVGGPDGPHYKLGQLEEFSIE